jgi:hypothetical protein
VGDDGRGHQAGQRVHGGVVDVRGGVQGAWGSERHELADGQGLGSQQLGGLLDGRVEGLLESLRGNL